jgi:hypothetical protein
MSRANRSEYAAAIDEALSRSRLTREPQWTEAIGVGIKEFVTTIADRIRRRLRPYIGPTAEGAWMVREAEAPYGADAGADPALRVRPRRPAGRTRRRGSGSSA